MEPASPPANPAAAATPSRAAALDPSPDTTLSDYEGNEGNEREEIFDSIAGAVVALALVTVCCVVIRNRREAPVAGAGGTAAAKNQVSPSSESLNCPIVGAANERFVTKWLQLHMSIPGCRKLRLQRTAAHLYTYQQRHVQKP